MREANRSTSGVPHVLQMNWNIFVFIDHSRWSWNLRLFSMVVMPSGSSLGKAYLAVGPCGGHRRMRYIRSSYTIPKPQLELHQLTPPFTITPTTSFPFRSATLQTPLIVSPGRWFFCSQTHTSTLKETQLKVDAQRTLT